LKVSRTLLQLIAAEALDAETSMSSPTNAVRTIVARFINPSS
jgi:hypothetical protein